LVEEPDRRALEARRRRHLDEIVKVELGLNFVKWAAEIGCCREIEAIRQRRKNTVTWSEPWDKHIIGALAEQAVAKWLGIKWSAVNTFKTEPDVGPYEVRGRPTVLGNKPLKDCLIVRPDDKPRLMPEQVWIAVECDCPTFFLHGWMTSIAATNNRYWNGFGSMPKAWFVPYENLWPMATLPAINEAWRMREALTTT
jgi:hypothetical protein